MVRPPFDACSKLVQQTSHSDCSVARMMRTPMTEQCSCTAQLLIEPAKEARLCLHRGNLCIILVYGSYCLLQKVLFFELGLCEEKMIKKTIFVSPAPRHGTTLEPAATCHSSFWDTWREKQLCEIFDLLRECYCSRFCIVSPNVVAQCDSADWSRRVLIPKNDLRTRSKVFP